MRAKLKYYSLILICLLATAELFAQKSQTFEFDDNKDKVIDNIFRYVDGALVEHLNDRNYDQKYDYKMQVKGNITRIEADNDFDGKFDRLEIISNKGASSQYQLYDINDGKKKLIVDREISNLDHRETLSNESNIKCSYENFLRGLEGVDDFIDNFDPIISRIGGGVFEFTPGVQIHKSCLDNLGDEKFPRMLRNALDKGLSCLSDLASQDKDKSMKGEISNLLNFFNIQLSGKVNPTKFICHNKNYNWNNGVVGYASTSEVEIKSLGIKHPFVSLNPKMEKSFFGGIKNGPSTDELEGVMFHEMIHNFGYRHGTGVDTSYGCEACCFGNDKAKKYACNICVGKYKDEMDSAYIRDMALMSKESGLVSAELFLYNNIERIPVNQENIDSFFIGLATRGPGVLQEFKKQMEQKGYKIRETSETKELIRDAKNYRPINSFIAKVSEAYARALIRSFVDKEPSKAKTALRMQITSKSLFKIADENARDSQFAAKLGRGVRMLEELL
ncbi:hypothetical protein [Halobacteriovorax sp.]|uniref:hypothetical protein n=1 Tax=Halobacteriovorax sp. TaxID=2020862 RepID=UPI003AF3155C